MKVLHKTARDWRVTPNLVDYAQSCAAFDWSAVPELCAGMGPGRVNIGYAAIDRNVDGPVSVRTALRFVSESADHTGLTTNELSYAELGRLTCQFTNVLRSLGIGKGDRLFILLDRCPELYISILGALRNGSVVSPLFSAFGPEPVATRMRKGEADVLVTTSTYYDRKVAPVLGRVPSLRHVILIDDHVLGEQATISFWDRLAGADIDAPIEPTRAEDPALLHFTSGTTGEPKAALHVHGAVTMHYITGLYALDLHPDDIYWCTADPGWVTGTSYGVIAPLVHGVTSVVDEVVFDAKRWYRILESQAVSVWYTSPTAIRMLIKAGSGLPEAYRFSRLRFIASVGEPLNAEAVWWGKRVFGLPIHDNWWQTETGGIMIANMPAFDIKPGSMGRPLPGVHAHVVSRSVDGAVHRIEEPGLEGELALEAGWPSMFRGYLHQEDRYHGAFADGLYLTGDLVKRDADGYFWFLGRADDVIKSSGHLVGPFEVENVLTDHPAVAEAAVIGIPDPTAGEIVKAFVTVKRGYLPDDDLRQALIAHARRRLGPGLAPRQLEFCNSLPHTRSGKIMRRLLKARELGLPEGDTSAVEIEFESDSGTEAVVRQ